MADQISGGSDRLCDFTWCRFDLFDRQLSALAIEAVENSIELYAHRVRKRPPGVVVGPCRRSAGIRKIVRVVLGLEHIQNVRTICLIGLYDIGSGRVRLAGGGKGRVGMLDFNAVLDKSIEKFDGCQK